MSISPHTRDARRTGWTLPDALAFEWAEQIDSTSSELMRRVRDDLLDAPLLLAAGEQTAGRGRLGRSWHTAPGDALTMSLAWPLRSTLALDGLSLAVGAALALALNGVCGEQVVRLKWPNDLLLAGRKLGGILVESVALGPRRWVVVGVGLNLGLPRAVDGAAALQTVWPRTPRVAEVGGLCGTALHGALERFAQHGFEPFRGPWCTLHAWQGLTVCALRRDEAGAEQLVARGQASGVDARGALLLECAGGTVRIATADTSLRLC
ncbi:MAG: biotin--[acetyl-CoA-carboxylase] ligase [Betaproteobacteria bacterium]|nr:biotin--[acetyl-CoA-carboxylase] ligase [Betaproteobacteria bacterium]